MEKIDARNAGRMEGEQNKLREQVQKGGEKLFRGEDRGGPGGKCGDNPKDYGGALKD